MDIPDGSVKQSFTIKEDFKKFLSKFTRTRKRKIITACSGVLVLTLLIGGGIVVSRLLTPQSGVKVAENLASDKVYDNYDFIYNSSDNKLVASTFDKLKQLELVSGDGKIIDYIISSDKKKITYSVADKDFKRKITSRNIPDLTKLRFDPVAFKIYELNLETGENRVVWSIDSIELGATQEQVYKQKRVVHPDSYLTRYEYTWDPVSYANIQHEIVYPVSYVSYEDDYEAGYNFDYLPWDLQNELSTIRTNLVGYSSDNNSIAIQSNNSIQTIELNTNNKQQYPLSYASKNTNGCTSNNNSLWVGNFIKLTTSCWEWGYEAIVKFENNGLAKIDYSNATYQNSHTVLLKPDYSLISRYKYSDEPKNTFEVFDFNTLTATTIKDLEQSERVIAVEANFDLVALAKPESNNDYAKLIYTFNKYIRASNTLEPLFEVHLPNDMLGFTYDAAKNRISYYRKYQASTETIIEYKVLDITTMQETDLVTLKVDNDSVLYYKPKLVWFDQQ